MAGFFMSSSLALTPARQTVWRGDGIGVPGVLEGGVTSLSPAAPPPCAQ